MMTQHMLSFEDVSAAHKPAKHIVLPPPKIAPAHDVFAETMLEDTSVRQRRSPLDWAVSLVLHVVVLSGLLIIPLYYTQQLDLHRLSMTFLVAPMPPRAAAPAPPPQAAQVSKVRPAARLIQAGKLMAPRAVPTQVAVLKEDPLPPDVVPDGLEGGVFGGIPGQGIVGGTNLSAGLRAAPAPVVEGPKKPVRIGGDVKPPRLLSRPEAEYPTLARQSRIVGTVAIEAIIDEHGHVIEARAISGHPLLIPSALKAVSARLYEPTILDGEPMSVDLRVEVNFRMG
jgi:periplasmic protein TonB